MSLPGSALASPRGSPALSRRADSRDMLVPPALMHLFQAQDPSVGVMHLCGITRRGQPPTTVARDRHLADRRPPTADRRSVTRLPGSVPSVAGPWPVAILAQLSLTVMPQRCINAEYGCCSWRSSSAAEAVWTAVGVGPARADMPQRCINAEYGSCSRKRCISLGGRSTAPARGRGARSRGVGGRAALSTMLAPAPPAPNALGGTPRRRAVAFQQ
jgi:hypothetical protein